jgi:hypothetical protein
MTRSFNTKFSAGVLPLAGSLMLVLLLHLPVFSQQPGGPAGEVSGVTMSIFPVERGADGQQYITTKAGFKVTVPGLGIAPDANEIAVYRNNENKFWYIDKAGVTQPVSEAQLQWTMAQINHQQAMRTIEVQENAARTNVGVAGMQPGMMPQQGYAQQAPTVIVNNSQPASSGVSTAAVSGLAAAGGAMAGSMAGAAISNSMYHGSYCGIPYGAACYSAAGHNYYNAADGAHEIPVHTDNPYMNQWSRQQAYDNNSQNRHNAYNNLNGNQQQMLKNEGTERMENREEHPAERMGGLGGLGRFRR